VAALSARWLDHLTGTKGTKGMPAVLPVVVVVATYSKHVKAPTTRSDTRKIINWLREEPVPGVLGFVVDGDGVHATD
jgi:hypothetical protein